MQLDISDDKKSVRIQINSSLNAQELEELIGELGALRSDMEPSVPLRSPFPPKEPYIPFAVEDDPTFDIAKNHKTGGVCLLMRSSAVGWMAYDLSPRNAAAMSRWLQEHVIAVPALEEADLNLPLQ